MPIRGAPGVGERRKTGCSTLEVFLCLLGCCQPGLGAAILCRQVVNGLTVQGEEAGVVVVEKLIVNILSHDSHARRNESGQAGVAQQGIESAVVHPVRRIYDRVSRLDESFKRSAQRPSYFESGNRWRYKPARSTAERAYPSRATTDLEGYGSGSRSGFVLLV